MSATDDLALGARNLLVGCGGFEAGSEVLIVAEDPALGWYDAAAPEAVAREAAALGMTPLAATAGHPSGGKSPELDALIAAHPNIVFFARIGDQDRFAEPIFGRTVVMSYVRTAAMLASGYGRTPHQAMLDLKAVADSLLAGGERITITCRLGTEVSGLPPAPVGVAPVDVSVRRFPMGVPAPVPAAGFSGRVALGRYLTPSGSRVYAPACLELDQPVFAHLDKSRITGFSGDARMVGRVQSHYRHVAQLFGIDADNVHSWHAGIHPGMVYDRKASDDPDRWSNTVFTSPRYLHFHTCGAYAPGEICWMVENPTVTVDGTPLWERGRFRPELHAAARDCLMRHPALAALFA